LAGGIAHDFNNLLTIIQGNVALLQEPLNPDQAGGLVEIAKAAERAANLTRQLLTFSRRQLVQPKPLDLNETVATPAKCCSGSLANTSAWKPVLPRAALPSRPTAP